VGNPSRPCCVEAAQRSPPCVASAVVGLDPVVGGPTGVVRRGRDEALPVLPADPLRVRVVRGFVDETYVKVAGRWRYVYRAVDHDGQVIDVYVSKKRDTAAPGMDPGEADHGRFKARLRPMRAMKTETAATVIIQRRADCGPSRLRGGSQPEIGGVTKDSGGPQTPAGH